MWVTLKRYLNINTLLVGLIVYGSQTSYVMAESNSDQIRIGFSSKAFVNVPKADMKIAIGVLSKKVARKTFGSVESRIYESPAEIENDLKSKRLDVIAITPDEFIYIRNRVSIEPAMITVAGNSHDVELLLLVRKDSGFNRTADLKGRTVVLPSWNAQYGSIYHTWLETLSLREGASSMDIFFSSITEASSANQAIMPVFFRKTASCVVSKQAFEISSELNPQLSRDLKVIARIGGLAGGLVVFRQDLSEDSKQKTRQALLDLDKDQEGRQLLMLFHLNSLALFRPEYLKSTEALYAEHSRLIARKR